MIEKLENELFVNPFAGFVDRLNSIVNILVPVPLDTGIYNPRKVGYENDIDPEIVYKWLQKKGYNVNIVSHQYLKDRPELGRNRYGKPAIGAINDKDIYAAGDFEGYKLPRLTPAAIALHEYSHDFTDSEIEAQRIALETAAKHFPYPILIAELYRIGQNIEALGER